MISCKSGIRDVIMTYAAAIVAAKALFKEFFDHGAMPIAKIILN